jgi:hypothetical protein
VTFRVFGQYLTDDARVEVALYMHPDTFAAMGFADPPLDTPRKVNFLWPRLEVFVNSAGKELRLPYPSVTPPYALGTYATLRGDPTYFAFQTLSERNRGEAV